MMNRRAFVTGLGAVLAAPLVAEGQRGNTTPVVGILHDRPAGPSAVIKTLQEELRRLGYVEYDLELRRYDRQGWRAMFFASGFEHSFTAHSGSASAPSPWEAVQRAASDALHKLETPRRCTMRLDRGR